MAKLLYITNGINGAGGLERVLSVKASYLAEKYDYDITILSLNDNHKNPFYAFSDKVKMKTIFVSGSPIRYSFQYIQGLKKIIKELQPDVISVCDDGLKAFFIPKLLGSKIPIVYERHVSKEIEMNHSFSVWKKIAIRVKWKLMEQLASDFSKFIVLTNKNKNEWILLENMIVIPNPLSFYPQESSSLKNKKVIAVGKQGYQKGYDLLLNSWKFVNAKHPDWCLEIYGTIAPEFKLAKQAEELQIEKTVFFYPPEKDIQSKYLESAVYVMSSRFEGFGMVLIEAMACGLPCVSFNCNYGPSDIIENGVDGFVIPNGDCEALANGIIELLSDEKLRTVMGKKAKENVKRFLPETIIPLWDDLFKSLNKNTLGF